MIVRMKEILLFTTARSVDGTVQRLGELGVVDIKEINQPKGAIMENRTEAVNRAERAITILTNYENKKNDTVIEAKYAIDDPKQVVDRVLQNLFLKILN